MRCGAKCFLVQIEDAGNKRTTRIMARTPAQARKFFRLQYGSDQKIISVLERKRT